MNEYFISDPIHVSCTCIYLSIYRRGMLQLHKSGGLFAVGSINWQLMLCLLGVYLICYFSLWKGISTSGKVTQFHFMIAMKSRQQ